jgi:Serine/threonine protein kinase
MLNSGYILDEKYEVVKTLGQGGMSTVYLCKNTRLGNLWAIKEVKKELKGQMDFLAEPNILKNLSHPGIPRVVDIFYREDNLYIVEDYIEGETLQDYIKKNGFIGTKQINNIALSICNIIEYLHSFNSPIIYRDLKPSNIMITPEDKIVLIDFGISRIYKQGGDKDTIYMGSKGYAAPEQYGIEQTCIQTDIYGLGAVMYFLATGKAPIALLEPLKDESYSNEVSLELKKIIQKAMQIDIKSRYSSVEEMKKELLRFSEKEYDTKTLLMQNSEEYSKTLFMNSNKGVFNDEINDKLFRSNAIKTTITDKSKFKDFNETADQEIHNGENNIRTKTNLNRGRINFYKVKSNSDETETEENTVKASNEKIKIGKSNKEDKKEVTNQKPKKTHNKLKMSGDKSKKSFKRKFISTLVCVAVIFGLAYLVTNHGKKEQIINSNQITNGESEDKDISDVSKPENKSDTNNIDNNKDNNKEDVKPPAQTTLNKPNTENSAINESTNDKGASTASDKNLQNKKESKAKNNGKGKSKHKYDEGDY